MMNNPKVAYWTITVFVNHEDMDEEVTVTLSHKYPTSQEAEAAMDSICDTFGVFITSCHISPVFEKGDTHEDQI